MIVGEVVHSDWGFVLLLALVLTKHKIMGGAALKNCCSHVTISWSAHGSFKRCKRSNCLRTLLGLGGLGSAAVHAS